MRVLAIDQGTSGTKAAVVEDGTVVALAEVPVRPQYLAGGRVEQDPSELLDSVLIAGNAAASDAGGAIDMVSLANQGETVLVWDPDTGSPSGPALVWQDGRAAEVCEGMSDHADAIAERTGLVLDPYFSAPKMAWLRRNGGVGGVVTTTDTWLLHHLTGEFVTDATTASRSLLMDLDTGAWDEGLTRLFGLQGEALPAIVDCDAVVGRTGAFGGDIPVGGLMVDQQAALVAESCIAPGSAKCTVGTGAFLLAACGSEAVRSREGLTTSIAHRTRDGLGYCIDGQAFTAASAVRWMVDVGFLSAAEHLDAACADDSRGVLFVPALAGLAAPWWRADARACFTGMSLATGAGELVRAVVEGVAAQIVELLRVVENDLGRRIDVLRLDGGLTRSSVLVQALADLAQRPIEVYASPHATAMGVATMGRMAFDATISLSEAVWPWQPSAVCAPRWTPDRAADFMLRWARAVQAEVS